MTEDRVKQLVYKDLANNLTDDERTELDLEIIRQPSIAELIAKMKDTPQLLKDLRKIHTENLKIQAVRRKKILRHTLIILLIIIVLVTTVFIFRNTTIMSVFSG